MCIGVSKKRDTTKVMSLQERIKRLKARDIPSSSSEPVKETLALREEMSFSSLPNLERENENPSALNIVEPSNMNVEEVEMLVHPRGSIPNFVSNGQCGYYIALLKSMRR